LTEVLGRSLRGKAVREAAEAIPSSRRVRTLLGAQRPDGGFGVDPYSKWGGAFWRLVTLSELDVPRDDPGVMALVDHVMR
jgi:hypothetical protein